MHKLGRGLVITGGAAIAAFGIAVSSASATAAYDLTVTNPNADGSFTATLVGTAHLQNVTTNVGFDCTESTASGTAASGTRPGGTNVASFNAQWGENEPCLGPLSSTWTATTNSAMVINGHEGYDSANDVLDGSLTSISVHVVGTHPLGVCEADITGTVNVGAGKGKWDNKTSRLIVEDDTTPQLTSSNVTGNCVGLVNEGDKATFSGTYQISPAITARP